MFPRFLCFVLCFVLVCALASSASANAGESPVQKEAVQAPVQKVMPAKNYDSQGLVVGILGRLRPRNWRVFDGSREFRLLPVPRRVGGRC